MEKPVCFAVDFDFTLAHFRSGLDGLLDIFIRRGVSQEVAYAAELEAEDRGFNISTYLSCIEARVGAVANADGINDEFNRWLTTSLILVSGQFNYRGGMARCRSNSHRHVR